ncbi:MAG: hypothetical protein R2753_08030 [Chitinophagales bacterium]
MNVFINQFEVDKKIISVNTGLNFGRFDYKGLVIDHYKIVLSQQELIDFIEVDYNEIKDEIKLDDDLQKETSEFSAINYCSLNELLATNGNKLFSIVTTYLDRILFEKLFPSSNNGHYIINSTDSVVVVNDKIEISGRTYRK